MSEVMLRVENLKKSFDGRVVLDGINLQVHQGEVVAVIGPSGTGQSTMLRCRDRPDLTPEQKKQIFRQAFSADVYLMSSNAVTEEGELYNVDGNSNRVAALAYGPDSVIVVAGCNKIVPDIAAAVERVKKIAAPVNATRLHCSTPCAKTGECMNCHSDGRICCNYLVSAQQRHQDRIKVILVGGELGY